MAKEESKPQPPSRERKIDISMLMQSLLAVALGFIAGGIMVAAAGYSPVVAYGVLLKGAFGDVDSIAETLAQATPLILTGLGVAVAFLEGCFNIGAEGQLFIGAFLAFLGGYLIAMPAPIHIPFVILMAIIGGAGWAILPAILKVKRGAHEVVTTIMMNWIAMLLTSYLTLYHFLEPTASIPETPIINSSAVLPIIVPRTGLSASFLVALICVFVVYYMLKRMPLGYEIRAVGLNPTAAEYGGIAVSKVWVIGMLISGALCGIGGAGVTLGTYRRFVDRFSPGYGFDGIAVALIGRNNPVGALLAAIFIGALYSGSVYMRLVTHMPKELVMAIEGIIIIFAAIPEATRLIRKAVEHWRFWRAR